MTAISTLTVNPYGEVSSTIKFGTISFDGGVGSGPGIAWSDLDYKNRNDIQAIADSNTDVDWTAQQEIVSNAYRDTMGALDKYALNIIDEINQKKRDLVSVSSTVFNFAVKDNGNIAFTTYTDPQTDEPIGIATPGCTPRTTTPSSVVFSPTGYGSTFKYNPVSVETEIDDGFGGITTASSTTYSVGARIELFEDQLVSWVYPPVEDESYGQQFSRQGEEYRIINNSNSGAGVTAYIFYEENDDRNEYQDVGFSTSVSLGYYYVFTGTCNDVDNVLSGMAASITSMRTHIENYLSASNENGTNKFRALKTIEEVNYWFDKKGDGERTETIYDYQGAQQILENRTTEINDNL